MRGRPTRPEDFCCCSESEVKGAGVDGGSALTLGGLPTRLFGGSGTSDAFDMTDSDLLIFTAGVALFSRGAILRTTLRSFFGCSIVRLGLTEGGEP